MTADPGEHERTAALLNEVFAFDPPLRAEDIRWYYDDNPLGPASVGRSEEDGRRLGNYALVPLRLDHGNGASVTLGVGVDLAVSPTARGKGTFRATVEDSYVRGAADGLDGILGVANANSAPRMVRTLGWRALPDLPARLLLPGSGRSSFTATEVTPGLLGSSRFDELVGAGFSTLPGPGFAPVWTAADLRWRLAKPRARYWLHDADDALIVSTVTRLRGLPFAVLLKTLPRSGHADVEGGALVRHLQRTHRTPFVVHFGRAPALRVRGIPLPRRALPSPLSLVLYSFTDRLDVGAFSLAAFEFLDFDAY